MRPRYRVVPAPVFDVAPSSVIRGALLVAGITPKAIAADLGVSEAHVNQVIAGKYAGYRVRSYIEKLLSDQASTPA